MRDLNMHALTTRAFALLALACCCALPAHAADAGANAIQNPVSIPLDAATLSALPREIVHADSHGHALTCEGVALVALLRHAGAMPEGELRGAQLARFVEANARAFALRKGGDLLPLLGADGRIAVALTDSVPAGKYAKASFEALGMWDALQPRLAQAENVRAALLLVARAEAPLGVVYGSDARAEPRVRVLAVFPPGSHPRIVYPVARVLASRQAQAAAFVRWLQTPAAGAIFRAHGFTTF